MHENLQLSGPGRKLAIVRPMFAKDYYGDPGRNVRAFRRNCRHFRQVDIPEGINQHFGRIDTSFENYEQFMKDWDSALEINDALDDILMVDRWNVDDDNELVMVHPSSPESEISDEIQELFAEETSRFTRAPKSSRGGVPVEYADHLFHLDNRPFIRQVVEDGEIDD
jgi:hypothetical protein